MCNTETDPSGSKKRIKVHETDRKRRKNMKKKLVAGFLATAMMASVFTGCGKKDDDDKKSEG